MSDRLLGTAMDYLGFIGLMRARVAELGVAFDTIDALAGLTDSHTSKLLAEEPSKNFGPMSLDAMLGALGCRIALVEDEARTARVKSSRHWHERSTWGEVLSGVLSDGKHRAKQAHIVKRTTRVHMRQIGALGGVRRAQKLSRKRRKLIAQKGGIARARGRRRMRKSLGGASRKTMTKEAVS